MAKELKTIMNQCVDPCDDFSSYVCGNLDKLHSIPPGESSFNSMDMLSNKIKNEFIDILGKMCK